VSGPTHLPPPESAHAIQVKSAEDMLNAVMTNIEQQDIFIAVAAVADYRPSQVSDQKIKKSGEMLNIQLVPNEDILAKVAGLAKAPFCVGFAAESENLLEYAEQKRQRKNIPLIAANIASEAMGADESALVLLDDNGSHALPKTTKLKLARALLEHVVTMTSSTK
jgi:phosphopantothenoylcysteine decarboxylase/phosphopantothenate--cysteine ligase